MHDGKRAARGPGSRRAEAGTSGGGGAANQEKEVNIYNHGVAVMQRRATMVSEVKFLTYGALC